MRIYPISEAELPDPRLHVVHGSAENVQRELDRLKLDGADYVISGIPFTTMPVELREKIMGQSREALRPGGAVLVYQFTRAVLPYLQTHFNRIHQDYEPRNILPPGFFIARRKPPELQFAFASIHFDQDLANVLI